MKEVIIDGVRYIPDPTQTTKQESPKSEKFVPEFDGQLCEVSATAEFKGTPAFRLMSSRIHFGEYMAIGGSTWRHCRPIQDPNIYQFRDHDGSDECPCDPNLEVVIRTVDGAFSNNMSDMLSWRSIAKWCYAK